MTAHRLSRLALISFTVVLAVSCGSSSDVADDSSMPSTADSSTSSATMLMHDSDIAGIVLTANQGQVDLGELARGRDSEDGCADSGDRGAAGGRGEEQRCAERHRRARQHHAGRAEPIQKGNQDQTAPGGADEIGGVDRIDARGEP